HQDRFNLMVPRSSCPCCGHQITALENIPVISYIALGGKCRKCQARISPRYPAIELLTAALSGLLVWTFGSGAAGMATLLFAWL
ncbi:prepilin peptidase, partial [Acinetobacter baumannii]|uniref:prepilin peptidase n=1 Tax=Acinetobacter baumannii TaxID=470 RepID=UPI00241C5B54